MEPVRNGPALTLFRGLSGFARPQLLFIRWAGWARLRNWNGVRNVTTAMIHVRALAICAVLLPASLLVGCATDDGSSGAASGASSTTTTAAPTTSEDPVDPDGTTSGGLPAVTVTGAGAPIELEAWTFCFEGLCADGAPPTEPADVGATDAVRVEFPLDDWAFEATFSAVGETCPRQITVPVSEGADGDRTVEPAGHPGVYDVTLSGRGAGEGGGDLFVTFRWTTTAEGTLPVPAARMAVLADNEGVVDSYGVELALSDLAATPSSAEATVTVRSSEGREHTFTPTPAESCGAGTVSWNGPMEDGKTASALGTGPFTYEVIVVLDGVSHVAEATWPDDVMADNEPSVALTFDPPLPAMD